MSFSPTRAFLARVLPWSQDRDGDAFFNIHWLTTEKTWRGRAFKDLDGACNQVAWLQTQPTARDIYCAMSSQRAATPKQVANGRTVFWAERSLPNALALKSLFIDVDVKAKGYASTADAIAALSKFMRDTGLPRPTLLVATGSGGFHGHWVLDRALTVDEWRVLALGLKSAAAAHGFMIDAAVTTDAARILRIPGTKNFKHDPPLPVLLGAHIVPNDYPVEYLREKLAAYLVAAPPTGTPGGKAVNDELAGGIDAACFNFDDFASAARYVAAINPSPWAQSADGGDGYGTWFPFLMACAYVNVVIGQDVGALFDEIVGLVGRDPEKNARMLRDAIRSTQEKRARGVDLVGPGSVFKQAQEQGWTAPGGPSAAGGGHTSRVALSPVEEAALAVAKQGAKALFRNGARIDRDRGRGHAVHFITKRVDPALRPRVILSLAALMAREGWSDGDITDTAHLCGQPLDEARRTAARAIQFTKEHAA